MATTPEGDVIWTDEEIDAHRNDPMPDIPVLAGLTPLQTGVGLAMAAMTVAAPGTKAAMLAAAASLDGIHERPMGSNFVPDLTPWYGIGASPWCDEAVSFEGHKSGNLDALGGKFAYCPAHTRWFYNHGLWKYGAGDIGEGDVVFFRWDRRRSLDADHVGVVKTDHGDGTYDVWEGNHNNKFGLVRRDRTYIAGRGRPKYSTQKQEEEMPEYVHLGNKELTIPAKGEVLIHWPDEYADTAGHHANTKHGTSYPSLMTGAKHGTRFGVSISTKDGTPVKWRLREVNPDHGYSTHKTYNPQDHLGWCDAGKHLWVYAIGDGTERVVDIQVKAEYFEYK